MQRLEFPMSLVVTMPAPKRVSEDVPTVPQAPRRGGAAPRIASENQASRWGAAPRLGTEKSGRSDLEFGGAMGRYVILSRLGAGAMGVVYAAHDLHLGRKVAVKVLRHDENAPDNAERARVRLLREARALAKLSHPNVVAVHDVGTLPDGIFIAMEFVPGKTLQQWLREEPRTQAQILTAFLDAGAGLAAAHAAGIVHRDFKPQNVLVGEDGRVRLLDFGLARKTADAIKSPERSGIRAVGPTLMDLNVTDEGEVLGTPAFMAPEQFMGEGVSPATDQFAFCVALYRALYGQRPFEGDALPELAAAVLEGHVTPAPRGVRIPARVRSALLRGLAVKPEDRFPSMDALLAELRAAATPKRWRVAAIAAAVLAVAVGAGLGHASGVAGTPARDQPTVLSVASGR